MIAGLALNANARPDSVPAVPPPAATAPTAPVAPSTPRAATLAVEASSDSDSAVTATAVLLKQVNDAVKDANKQQRDALRQQHDAMVKAQRAMENSYTILAKTHAGMPSQMERALVIRSSKTDAKTLAAMQEDLRVMSRILHKALHQSGDDGQQHAMGISMVSATDGSRARNIQIEGFGAIFLLHVNFPLAGPETKSEDAGTKEPTNTAWDQARREIYGRNEDPFTAATISAYGARQKYDAKRVERLKDSLLEALKNASNIRYLGADECVTIVVSNGDGGWEDALGSFQVWEKLYNPNDESDATVVTPPTREWKSEASEQATMTIRAKKSDIDGFAKGKINLDEFRKKASILIY